MIHIEKFGFEMFAQNALIAVLHDIKAQFGAFMNSKCLFPPLL